MQPVIAISADRSKSRRDPAVSSASAYDTYIKAVVEGANGLPWVLPPIGERLALEQFVGSIDGIVLTGSLSNVAPQRYGQAAADGVTLFDPARDATILPLIHALLDAGVPLFAICRGFQELNVALGGTLHQQVHTVPDMMDHRAPKADSWAERFAHAHSIHIVDGGALAAIAGARTFRVNSLHEQGMARLANGLQIEAQSDDGLVEAASVIGADTFAFGVQWHPEWLFDSDPLNTALWREFRQACERRHQTRTGV